MNCFLYRVQRHPAVWGAAIFSLLLAACNQASESVDSSNSRAKTATGAEQPDASTQSGSSSVDESDTSERDAEEQGGATEETPNGDLADASISNGDKLNQVVSAGGASSSSSDSDASADPTRANDVGSSNVADTSEAGTAVPQVVCSAPTPINSKEELMAALDGVNYQCLSVSQSTVLVASQDYISAGAFSVTPEELQVPPSMSCPDIGTPEISRVWIRLEPFLGDVPASDVIDNVQTGVSCEGEDQDVSFDAAVCERMQIARGAVFRLRATIQDLHPSPPEAFIEFVAPCADACEEDEYLCTASQTCISSARFHCQYCAGRPTEECACDPGVQSASVDGAECRFEASPDYTALGVCSGGLCQPEN